MLFFREGDISDDAMTNEIEFDHAGCSVLGWNQENSLDWKINIFQDSERFALEIKSPDKDFDIPRYVREFIDTVLVKEEGK